MALCIRKFLLLPLVLCPLGCSTQRASLPNQVVVSPEAIPALNRKELELSQQAALDASRSATEAMLESEKVQKAIAELKSEVQKLSVLAGACSDMAKKSDQKRAHAAALRAKKEVEEKKAIEAAAAVALPEPTARPNTGDYSRSDAPPGYYPDKPAPPQAPAGH